MKTAALVTTTAKMALAGLLALLAYRAAMAVFGLAFAAAEAVCK